jgi:hypothetical protein
MEPETVVNELKAVIDEISAQTPVQPTTPTPTPAPTTYQDRVRTEKAELDAKIEKLQAFVDGDVFKNMSTDVEGADERGRLKSQLNFMRGYSDILGERIIRF